MNKENQEKVGKFLGIPYDWRKPTMERYRSRIWNPKELRIMTPKAFGWGYDLNFYRLFHPTKITDKK